MLGKAGKLMEVYHSDLSNEEWVILEPLIPPGKAGGRPREVDMRAVLNGLFYVLRLARAAAQLSAALNRVRLPRAFSR